MVDPTKELGAAVSPRSPVPMRGDPATPCTALPPPTVASRSDGQGHAVMTKVASNICGRLW